MGEGRGPAQLMFLKSRTRVVLYAKGAMTYFSAPIGILKAELIKRAVFFLRRAVCVLKETQVDEAIWTLAATYRLAACLFDLGQTNGRPEVCNAKSNTDWTCDHS